MQQCDDGVDAQLLAEFERVCQLNANAPGQIENWLNAHLETGGKLSDYYCLAKRAVGIPGFDIESWLRRRGAALQNQKMCKSSPATITI